ncbi:MAG: restriction endonuclease [Waterburya sp.]
MPIPDYPAIMLPLLEFAGDKQEHSLKETIPVLANYFNLTEEEQKELLRCGSRPRFNSQVYKAKSSLIKAGLLIAPHHGTFLLTQEGLEALAQNLPKIEYQFLKRHEKYCKYIKFNNTKPQEYISVKNPDQAILEKTAIIEDQKSALENAYQQLQQALAREILESIKKCSPIFFESLVVDLLVCMGYGGSRKEAGKALQISRDEGIDGIIKEDRLGLDIIYIQAKCWENIVGRPEIQKFAGALQGQKARKGVFITTSSFTNDAKNYVKSIETKIILIDGHRLTELMIEYNVGVTSVAKYEIKKIDSDYFIED